MAHATMAASAPSVCSQTVNTASAYRRQEADGGLKRCSRESLQQHLFSKSPSDVTSRRMTCCRGACLSKIQDESSARPLFGRPILKFPVRLQGLLCELTPSNFSAVCTGQRHLLKFGNKKRQPVRCQAIGRQDPGSNLTPALELEPGIKGAKPVNNFNGIFLLLILNIGIYVVDHVLRLPVARSLYLNHMRPEWWQFVTSTFCHFNWNHLSSNLFFLYIFGKLVEEEEGSLGVWASYLITGLGANVVSFFLLPHSSGGAAVASCGASGAVFGLFAISVLVKLSWNWRKILEVLILGQFVVEKVIAEAAMSARGTQGLLSGGINHVAHLAGALVGVALILFITKLPEVAAGGKDPGRLE